MTEITRVPLQPIAKGSLTKLWLGVIAAVVIGIALAFAAMPKGVRVSTVTAGTGAHPNPTDVIFVNYVGKLSNGKVFDESHDPQIPLQGLFPKGTPLPLSRMIPGFAEGAVKMQKGGKYTLFIPAEKGYGNEGQKDQQGNDVIPANSDLTFDVELIDFMTEADFQRRVQVIQQMMSQQQGAGPRGEAGPPPQPAQ